VEGDAERHSSAEERGVRRRADALAARVEDDRAEAHAEAEAGGQQVRVVVFIIILLCAALVWYAIQQGLIADVFDPFVSPGPGR
jgi:hypothetical protein